MSNIVDEIGRRAIKEVGEFQIGDTVDVHTRIVEGDKERIQIFTGVVIARNGGTGVNAAFTVRRLVDGQGVERVFPLHSPKVEKVVVKKTGRVRRAKLHYLRDRVGKATRLRERRHVRVAKKAEVEAAVEAAPEAAPETTEAPEATTDSAEE